LHHWKWQKLSITLPVNMSTVLNFLNFTSRLLMLFFVHPLSGNSYKTSGVQTRLFGVPGIVRSNAYLPGWWQPSRLRRQLTILTCARCHIRTTALETEALALSAHEFGTVCRAAYGHLTSATNILRRCWRHVSTRPRRFVKFYISALEIFLLTYYLSVRYLSRQSIRSDQLLEYAAVAIDNDVSPTVSWQRRHGLHILDVDRLVAISV